jgi:FMN-dependent oxidoreductase (nitrilotriacetate monooxygenase family)
LTDCGGGAINSRACAAGNRHSEAVLTRPSGRMKLAGFFHPPGSHVAGWRLPEAASDSDMNPQLYFDLTRAAERGKMDCVFFQDSLAANQSEALGRRDPERAQYPRGVIIEPLMLLPALAMITKNIGLIATQSTTYNEPYVVARHFASLDHISGGRSGWNLVTTQNEESAGNFGLDQHVDHGLRYERAEEFFEVCAKLWDGWDDDALLRDKENGIYFDVKKVRLARHEGRFFRVRGPLNCSRSPQGRPIIAQAGSSEPGKELAAKTSDVVFTAQHEPAKARAFLQDVKGRMAKYGREPDHLKILPGFIPIVGETRQEAQDKLAELNGLITDDLALHALSRHTGGVDLTKFPIDGPLPPLGESNSAKGRQQLLVDMAREENLSIRQLGQRFAAGSGHRIVAGTAKDLADNMEEWFTAGAADGFTIMYPYVPGPAHDFVEKVIPELQRRDLFRTEYEGSTLRENLGLPMPKRVMES